MDKDLAAKLSETISFEPDSVSADGGPHSALGSAGSSGGASGASVAMAASTSTATGRSLSSVMHPNVATVQDLGLDANGDIAVTTGRIEGPSLKDFIAASTPDRRDEHIATPNQVVSIVIGVCGALAKAHHQRFVHQDVKPGNIMAGDFGEVLLIDWRSAIHLDDPAERRRIQATPLYMSPEQANRKPADARSDVYSLGATLFEMLLLRPPTLAADEAALWAKKRAGAIDRPTFDERSRVPRSLLAIALKALAADAKDRYQDAAAMLKDLRDYQEGLVTSARPGSLNDWPMRFYRRNRRLFWLAVVSAVVVASALWRLEVEKAKERSQWRVVYDASFAGMTPQAFNESWTASVSANSRDAFSPIAVGSSACALDARGLTLHGTLSGYTDVAFKNDLVGDIRVEWDYLCDKHNLDYNCFIGGANRWTSHMFHVGSWNNPAYAALTHGQDYSVIDSCFLERPMVAGHPYRFAMEQENGRLRLLIDERVIFDLENPSDIYGDHSNTFGFDAVSIPDSRISHVRVLHKPLPQRVSPLAVADSLMQMRDYPRAAQHYLDIETSYPDTELSDIAHFRYAICGLRMGDTARSCETLQRFAAEHPNDALTPYACYELIHALGQLGDKQAVSELLERCVRWKGHPVLARVMAWIADSHLNELQALPVLKVGDPEHRPDVVACIKMTISELQDWGHRYDVAWYKNTYTFIAGDLLRFLGDGSDVIANFPRQSLAHQSALGEAGRFKDVLTVAPLGSSTRAWALSALGRSDEVLADGNYPEDVKWDLYVAKGDLQKLLAHRELVPTQWARTLLLAGRYEEVLDEPATAKTLAAALIALGRAGEIEKRTDDTIAISRALVELGDYDALLKRFPAAYENLYLAAQRQWIAGDRAAAERLFADLDRAQVPLEVGDTMFARYIFPGFAKLVSGTSTDPAAEFDALINRSHDWYGQGLWYLLSYLAGRIDDRAFRAQPDAFLIEDRLLQAQAMASDLRGDKAAAYASYARFTALPSFATLHECDREFFAWRLEALKPAAGAGEAPQGTRSGGDTGTTVTPPAALP